MFDSQPLLFTPSQFEKPALHDAIAHMLAEHELVAFASAHARPHAPQFAGSLLVSMHPDGQQVCDEAHAGPPLQVGTVHRPRMHIPPAGQTLPHMPHDEVESSRDSQPFANEPSQSPKPGLQMIPHVPPLHVAFAFAPAGHAMPQPPQLFTSLVVNTQVDPQHVLFASQAPPEPQPPPLQKPLMHI